MFSLAENFRIDPKFHSLDLQEYFVRVEAGETQSVFPGKIYINVQLGAPPEYFILGRLRLRDVNNISIPRVNSNLFFNFLT